MGDRTARWTTNARTALDKAEAEARARNSSWVGQEHLLLGLVKVVDGAALTVLRELDARPDAIRTEADLLVGRAALTPAHQPYTPRLETALTLAADEADAFLHPAVGTDHLLLGMLREGEGMGADILRGHGITLSRARDCVLRLHAAGVSEP